MVGFFGVGFWGGWWRGGGVFCVGFFVLLFCCGVF